MRNGSKSEYFHVEGGLKLTRMRQSEWRRRWGVQGIISFDAQVGAGADDGWSDANGAFSSGAGNILTGESNTFDIDSWHRFTNVTIPAGATVQAANMTIVGRVAVPRTLVKTQIHLSDEDDPAAPTTQVEHAADPRTTNNTTWDDVEPAQDVETDSPDISLAVQEILDRGGWASGQAMMVLFDDDGSASPKFHDIYSYENDSSKAMQFHVEYSA